MRTNGVLPSSDFNILEDVDTDIELADEREMATVTNTAKWKEIKKYLEGRIEFWKKALPAGLELGDVDEAKIGKQWVRANDAIFELQTLLNVIENTSDAVRSRKG